MCSLHSHFYVFHAVQLQNIFNVLYMCYHLFLWKVFFVKPSTHLLVIFSFKPSGLNGKKNWRAQEAPLYQPCEVRTVNSPTELLCSVGGTAPCQHTPVITLSHWLRALIRYQSADFFQSYPFDRSRLNGPPYTQAECSVETWQCRPNIWPMCTRLWSSTPPHTKMPRCECSFIP